MTTAAVSLPETYRKGTRDFACSVALLVLPWLELLLDTWVGVLIGVELYVASRLFAPAEEAELASSFGSRWDAYRHHVSVPRL
jgi:protein-S-isoprenylcysteine O-methyltransferase Ste14